MLSLILSVSKFAHSVDFHKTDNSGVFAHNCQYSALEQVTHQFVADLAQTEVLRRSGQHHAVADSEKDTGRKIHRRLVVDQDSSRKTRVLGHLSK